MREGLKKLKARSYASYGPSSFYAGGRTSLSAKAEDWRSVENLTVYKAEFEEFCDFILPQPPMRQALWKLACLELRQTTPEDDKAIAVIKSISALDFLTMQRARDDWDDRYDPIYHKLIVKAAILHSAGEGENFSNLKLRTDDGEILYKRAAKIRGPAVAQMLARSAVRSQEILGILDPEYNRQHPDFVSYVVMARRVSREVNVDPLKLLRFQDQQRRLEAEEDSRQDHERAELVMYVLKHALISSFEKIVFLLKEYHQETIDEIAKKLDEKANRVERAYLTGRKKLRRIADSMLEFYQDGKGLGQMVDFEDIDQMLDQALQEFEAEKHMPDLSGSAAPI